MKIKCADNPVKVFEDFESMFERQRRELGRFGDDYPLNINWGAYQALQKNKQLVAYLCLDDANTAVGYALFIITHHLHYDLKYAANDVFYLRPECRKGLAGYDFLKMIEKELSRIGINVIIWSVKPNVDYSKLLKRLGYDELETNYFRRL